MDEPVDFQTEQNSNFIARDNLQPDDIFSTANFVPEQPAAHDDDGDFF
jgi:hypothetical protein